MKNKSLLSTFLFLLFAVATTWAETVDLSTVTTDKSLRDGDVVTGTLGANVKISIANNATVTLNGVTINGVNDGTYKWAGITCEGDCNIILAEETSNYVKGFYKDYPGIYVPNGKTLAISGTGSLETSSNGRGAGIGCGYDISCGNIEISGGTISATGGVYSAGIGGGYRNGNAGDITISGGSITAAAGDYVAAIGAGSLDAVGNITISGDETKVTAKKGRGSLYSIGKGDRGSRGTITIGGIETSDIEIDEFDYTKWKHLTHTDITVIADYADKIYTGSAICPEVSITDGTTPLKLNEDYMVECSNNVLAGTANVTITGMGNIGKGYYAGSISRTFKIVPKEISIAWDEQASFAYNGTEQAPTATAEGLVNGDECTITVSGATKNVGTHTAMVTALSNTNYKLPTENLEKTFEITPKEISIVWGGQTLFYSGTEQAPTATAKGLVSGDVCLITVSGAKDVGIHTATATALSNSNYKLPTENLETQFEIKNPNKTTDLSSLTKKYTAQDGEMLTGSLTKGYYKISIAKGATVILNGVTINKPTLNYDDWAGITCEGDCNIILAENSENIVKSFNSNYPGISIPEGSTLTILGAGSLEAINGQYGAGIGAPGRRSCGNIVILGGTITATGGLYGAGIGGANMEKAGNITILGGTITAIGGKGGSGIGGGQIGNVGNIIIGGDETKVTATKGEDAPYSIGSGKDGNRDGKIIIGGIETQDIEIDEFDYTKWKLLTHTDITVADVADQTYTGSAICPDVVVKDGETQLVGGVDYTVECTNNVAVGQANVTITGMGNIGKSYYAGSISRTFKIVPKEITIAWGEQASFAYNGTEQAPTATAEGLANGDECTITVSGAAKNVGSYTATATELSNSNYKLPTENLKKPFEITPKEITIAWGKQTTFAYDGAEHIPTAAIEGLLDGDNCELTVTGAQKNVGSYTASATELSNSNYKLPTENLEKSFEITPKEISIAWGEQTTFAYNGTEQAPTATAGNLVSGDECIITVSGAIDVGKHTATATELSNSNYKLPTENLEKPFEITPKEITIAWGKQTTFAYDGAEHIPTAAIEGLLDGDNCELTVTGAQKNVGSYTASATELNNDNYKLPTENLKKPFEIKPKEISITWGDAILAYDGTEQAPTATLEGLVNSNDCSITVSGAATDVGTYTATATVACNDNYIQPTANLEKSFEITSPNLALLKSDYVAKDLAILTGELAGNYKISIADGATVTLDGVTINGVNNGSYSWAGITCEGDCNIILVGTNTVKGFYEDYPGIYVPEGKKLTISGTGFLDASSNGRGAGIGGGDGISCGNITISGGSVTATGGTNAAGIGGGWGGNVGNIIISGGSVNATGNNFAAGIGGGYSGNVGKITITDGVTKVTAIKGNGAPYSVGKSDGGSSESITIASLAVNDISTSPWTFTGKTYTVAFDANGGSGTMADQVLYSEIELALNANSFTCEGLYFAGWNTKADGTGEKIADQSKVLNLTEAGKTITLYARWLDVKPVNLAVLTGDYVAQDGDVLTGALGGNYKISIADGATVTLDGVTINGVNSSDYKWAGITCEGDCNIVLAENSMNKVNGFYRDYPGIYVPENYTLTISGTGFLEARGKMYGAGIGGGNKINSGNIEIRGGSITAMGERLGAGIGGGWGGNVGNIVIRGGFITAMGETYGAGIGSGYEGNVGNIVISAGSITATGAAGGSGIGGGYKGHIGKIEISGGSITATTKNMGASIGGGGEGNAENIVISGGVITATSQFGAGIGGGREGTVGNITISGAETKITATKGKYAPYSVGKGRDGSRTGKITIGGIETSDIDMDTFKYPYLMLVYEDGNGKHAVLNGEYSGDESVNITEDIKNVAVTFNRTFKQSGFATIVLPFDYDANDLEGVKSIIEFTGMRRKANGDTTVGMSYVWCNKDVQDSLEELATAAKKKCLEENGENCEDLGKFEHCNEQDYYANAGKMVAYTPYMVQMGTANISFKSNVTLKKTITPEARVGDWVFRGTLESHVWTDDETKDGKIWAFAGKVQQSAKYVGQFVKLGGGASATALKAYMICEPKQQNPVQQVRKYVYNAYPTSSSGDRVFAPVSRLAAANPPALAGVETSSLESLDVVIVSRDQNKSEERTTIIGSKGKRTGEIRMNRNRGMFDLKGRRVNESKKAKGVYYKR